MTGPELVRGLQERAARALPAPYIEVVAGWWLRYAPGGDWWMGTVLPHGGGGPADVMSRIVHAERFYAGRGVVARFQVSPRACPRELDRLLAERGYRRESPMSLRAASTAQVLERTDRSVESPLRIDVDGRPTQEWFRTWRAVLGDGSGDPSGWTMLERVDRPSAYARAMIGDDVVAVGRAVADAGWAGVFGMATLPRARGMGAASGVLAALGRWAVAHQADRMYLQVERGNLPALRLYERAGFTELCGYHYRALGEPRAGTRSGGRRSRSR